MHKYFKTLKVICTRNVSIIILNIWKQSSLEKNSQIVIPPSNVILRKIVLFSKSILKQYNTWICSHDRSLQLIYILFTHLSSKFSIM
jgi:hypothetical protein